MREYLPRLGYILAIGLSLGLVLPVTAALSAGPAEPLPGQSWTLLNDGRWVGLGGLDQAGVVANGILWDPQTGLTTYLPRRLAHARAGHTATVLPDGTVLVFGGIGVDGKVVAYAEQFDPTTMILKAAPPRDVTPRAWHTATLLTDGSLLMVGGIGEGGTLIVAMERWNALTQTADVLPFALATPRAGAQATLLPDGAVLVWGGTDATGRLLHDGEILDPRQAQAMVVNDPSLVTIAAGPPTLEALNPPAGAVNVPVDTVFVARFSTPLEVTSMGDGAIALTGPAGPVSARVVAAEGGRLAFLTPDVPLDGGTRYTLTLSGLADPTGFLLPFASAAFTTTVPSPGPRDPAALLGSHAHQPLVAQPATPAPGVAAQVDDLEWRGLRKGGKPHSLWQDLGPLRAPPGVTAVAGQVLQLNGDPLPRVTLQVGDRMAQTDETGRFLLADVTPGYRPLLMLGYTANAPARSYGLFEYGIVIEPKATTVLPFTIWMPLIDTTNAIPLPQGRTTRALMGRTPRIPGLEVHVPAGVELRTPSGRFLESLSLTPVPVDRSPFPLPEGTLFLVVPQGHGTSVLAADGAMALAGKGVRVVFPSVPGTLPGKRYEIRSYEPHAFGWFTWAEGSVSPDGEQIITGRGETLSEVGCVLAFGPQEMTIAANLSTAPIMDPVDPSTGVFLMQQTDLVVPDLIPIVLQRSYGSGWTVNRAFGKGSLHNYDIYVTGDGETFSWAELVVTSGARIRFTRSSPPGGHATAVMEHAGTSPDFSKAVLAWNTAIGTSGMWELTFKDGRRWQFQAGSGVAPRLGRIIDRMGNALVVTRPPSAPQRITGPSGRWIELTLGLNGRVTQAQDDTGRTVVYDYDPSGRLWKVTNPAQGMTEYGYDAADRMVSIKDARGIVYLTNEYDPEGRVWRQTQPEGIVWTAAYTVEDGKVTETEVTDPRVLRRRLNFNGVGQVVADTRAVGTAQEQTTSYEWHAGTKRLQARVDPLPPPALTRRTEYTYDANGNVLTVKRMAGTTEAVTTTLTYEPIFNQVASIAIADPSYPTVFGYYANGNLKTITNPLGHETVLTYTPVGQVETITTPAGQTAFTYDAADLIAVTDPLGRVTRRFNDSVGRPTVVIDPRGNQTRYEYDPLNRLRKITDALGGLTKFDYDPNGNLLMVTDAQNKTTIHTYDDMDRVETRRDPLTQVETYQYDPNGNLTQVTDRRGKVTAFSYDSLDRRTRAEFGKTGPSAYESAITYGYDAGHRLRTVADSLNGTLTLGYDSLDRLTEEQSPQGTVSYGYDAVGRRRRLTVPGQPDLIYDYDNADRLTKITRGTAEVSFDYYPTGQRRKLTLPNGVTVDYDWDAASQLTELRYKKGAATLGSLTYTYDRAGNRSQVGGTWARTGLPDAISAAATYNDGNHQLTLGDRTMTYDLAGNLATLAEPTGPTTYTWDARGQLTSLTTPDGPASFLYDGLGRRRGKIVNGVQTDFLYDGLTPVQERQGAAVTNLLTGPGIDEYFTRTTAADTRTVLSDALGSTRALVDDTGAIQTEYTYKPFGGTTETGADSNSFQYTGREHDGTGLYYYRARYYHPGLQRFISEDPLGLAGGDPNLYSYVFNSPVNFTDPSGEIAPAIAAGVACAAGAIGGTVVVLSGRKPTLGSLAAGAGIGCAGGLAVLGAWVVAAPYMLAAGTTGASLWPSPEAGRQVIRAIEYTEHALERMAPSGLIKMVSRGVPPSVVENAIKFGTRSPGSEPGRVVHTFENVRVVTENGGRVVVTVIKTGHHP